MPGWMACGSSSPGLTESQSCQREPAPRKCRESFQRESPGRTVIFESRLIAGFAGAILASGGGGKAGAGLAAGTGTTANAGGAACGRLGKTGTAVDGATGDGLTGARIRGAGPGFETRNEGERAGREKGSR